MRKGPFSCRSCRTDFGPNFAVKKVKAIEEGVTITQEVGEFQPDWFSLFE
jgi:hypothetical protein